jgi:hypothetical protein
VQGVPDQEGIGLGPVVEAGRAGTRQADRQYRIRPRACGMVLPHVLHVQMQPVAGDQDARRIR